MCSEPSARRREQRTLLLSNLPRRPAEPPQAQAKKPNILVIWGDDIGIWNISFNSKGMMGYTTPNIDRIANEGIAFTDYYGQQSCTAGRAAFISGSVPVRTGMTKVGMPGAKEGWQQTDVTMATVLKSQGYATGQFGKNHQGDRDEHLPTKHGFDEFFGNLYHLNAEEEPENRRLSRRHGAGGREDLPGSISDRAASSRPLPTAKSQITRAANEEAHGDGRRRDARRGEGFHHSVRPKQASHSSAGGMPRGCTSAPT